jgi:hypothetical protein
MGPAEVAEAGVETTGVDQPSIQSKTAQRTPAMVGQGRGSIAGVPTGGQFASKLTAELSGFELIDDAELVDTWCRSVRPDTGAPAGLSTVDVELAVEAARRSGHFLARRYGCDFDDLASETVLAWWGR